MHLQSWYRARGARFVWERGLRLLRRYGVAPARAARRIDACVDALRGLGCAPTFPTPGVVVQRYPQFIRQLQDAGAEIAVHSYEHVDLSAMSIEAARQQLVRAVRTFERYGIAVHGFRCPYLGYSEALRDALPDGMFDYSSNEVVSHAPDGWASPGSGFYDTLHTFYRGRPFSEVVCTPSMTADLVEIPVCVPDDLQLVDGLGLGPDAIGQAWLQVLEQTHARGELFNLMFHPELASYLGRPFESLLRRASRLVPPVWVAPLRDVSHWWREKSGFTVETCGSPTGLRLTFRCSPRATIVVRGLGATDGMPAWYGPYTRLQSRTLDVPAEPRPFIGLSASAPESLAAFLREQGYIVDRTGAASRCAVCLDAGALDGLTQVQIIDRIEASPGPLVRYWRWPDGARGALCITGDLDALTLRDYAGRLLYRPAH